MNFFEKFNKLKNKKQIKNNVPTMLFISAFALLLVVGGTSYAYLTDIQEGTLINTVSAGNLELSLDDESSAIILNRAIPQLDDDALENNKTYTFSMSNSGTILTHYEIFLSNVCNTSRAYTVGDSLITPDVCVPDQYIKVGIKKGDSPWSIANFENGKAIIDTGEIEAEESSELYTIKLWLDITTPSDYSAIDENNNDRDVLFVANLNIFGEQRGGEITSSNIVLGKGETKTISYSYSGTEEATCSINDISIASCSYDKTTSEISVTGLIGGSSMLNIKAGDKILKTYSIAVYEAPTVPTIVANDGIESGKWHINNTVLSFSGSSIENGYGEPAYYYGKNEFEMQSGISTDSISNSVDGELYFVKACNSEYPTMCSDLAEYELKLDKENPTVTYSRINTNQVNIICKDSVSGIKSTQVWWIKPGTSSWSYEYGSDWSGYSTKYTTETVYFKTVTTGTHQISTTCKDIAGRSASKDASYYVGSSGSGSTSTSTGSASISGTCSCYDTAAPQTYHYICSNNSLKNSSQCSSFCSARGLAYYGSTCTYQ